MTNENNNKFLCFSSIKVTKTNRIARILAGSKKRIITKKPRFMSSASQVVISCFLICIEIGILTFTLVKEPADSMLDYPTWDKVILVCNTTSLGIILLYLRFLFKKKG